ncbi:MAG: ATP-grasp fold amidoligase family protein, partial [Allosphingosinicella sp.]
WRHGELANLASPRSLTEHIQRRKLRDRDPRYPPLADKVAVKKYVAPIIGRRWIVPTLWQGNRLPAAPAWVMPFVVKSRHGCGHVAVVRTGSDYERARRRSRKWMRTIYGQWLDEWSYSQIPAGLMVEPYIGKGPELPIDYKLFVFGGRVRYVQVHLSRASRHRWIVMDAAWCRVSPRTEDDDPQRPQSLGQMIEAAEILGAEFDFVRADFYEVEGQPLFGELTFYPGSGLEPVHPPELNEAMGAWWSDARGYAHPGEHFVDQCIRVSSRRELA